MEQVACPFSIGDKVRFTPSQRTKGLYQNIEGFGVRIGEKCFIKEIREGMYLYFEGSAGGRPWNEFTKISQARSPLAPR